ncbi:hypothetical protein SAMN05660733_02161 [Lentzea albidocapillata]|uniref:Uncharacterized protein n=1 Tax=Lentzea albidocapillata TaxID=40571 RepID=A0A1W2CKP4_9PSEU|nr:hypothetical protein SAMN05660733_02161 [Lentzea albidocapillata]
MIFIGFGIFIFSRALGFFGLVWTAYGAWLLIRARRLRARWAQIPGVITDLV